MHPKTVKNILTTIILTAVMILLMSNKTPDNLKIWDTKDKLTWKDYIDTTIDHSDRAALTNSGIRVSFNQTEANKITINAYSAMDRDKSWVDVTKKSGYILSHEQYHFNITEYWCRRLKKDLSEASFTNKNLKPKIESIRKEDFRQMHDMQEQYDHETNHSEIIEQQKKWEKKIDELLKSMEAYSGKSFTVNLK